MVLGLADIGFGASSIVVLNGYHPRLVILTVQYAWGSTNALRFAIGGSGVWWALFSILALLLLPGASGFEEAQKTSVSEEREGLFASEH